MLQVDRGVDDAVLHEEVSLQGGRRPEDKIAESALQVDEIEVQELVQLQDVHVEAHHGAVLALRHCH